MNLFRKRTIFASVALGLALFGAPRPSYALFGVGDIVFDPTAFAQLIKDYQEYEQMTAYLNQMAGYENSQLNTLNSMNSVLGPQHTTANPFSSSNQSVLGAVASIPGINQASLGSSFYTSGPLSGSLDIFMGMPVATYTSTYANPWTNFTNYALSSVVQSVGADIGLSDQQTAFANWAAKQVANNATGNQRALGLGTMEVLINQYAQNQQQRRQLLQTHASAVATAASQADAAKTVQDQLAAANRIAATHANATITASQQSNDAHEVMITTEQQQTHLLELQATNRALQSNASNLPPIQP
jgi:hypothetical protein